ncbi:MAG: substrate-binding domain-containing protein [Caldimonas sp.]
MPRLTAGMPFPPWQNGANNPSIDKGLEFTVPEVDNLADFHGNLNDPKLVLYYGGNSFFSMAPLVKAFEARYPQYRGRVYFETLPPGLLARQMANGGTITTGNMTWTVKPDVFFAGLNAVKGLIDKGQLTGAPVPYVTNTLAIMVAKGNPKGIKTIADLARSDVRLAMPNPAFEGVARQIQQTLVKAGGEDLKAAVYERKVKDGSAMLTQIHHRQTPLYIMQGKVDAGVTWQSEVVFQQQSGHPIEAVTIADDQNTTAVYAGAAVKGSAHPQAAADWLTFIRSPDSLAIFSRYGFKPYEVDSAPK